MTDPKSNAVPVVPRVEPDRSLLPQIQIEDVRRAATCLQEHAHRTPVITSRTLDDRVGAEVFVKCENFQRVGAFKFRGAYNALAQLEPEVGVLTYSSGNHAQAVALAAAELGRQAVIVMPNNAPAIKRQATSHYLARAKTGSRVVLYDPSTTVRETLGHEIAAHEGLVVIPPYDHPHVIAGQGTAALELFAETGSLDFLLVPCGGGGLLSGSAVTAASVAPGCQVMGVEPKCADDATRSFETGHLHRVYQPPTIADGARTPSLGKYTFAVITEHVAAMHTVSETEIARATLFAWERLKLVVEPSGALGLAGLFKLAQSHILDDQRIGIIISGGNMDPSLVGAIVTRAEASTTDE